MNKLRMTSRVTRWVPTGSAWKLWLLACLAILPLSARAGNDESWKGPSDKSRVRFSAMSGLALVDDFAGLGIIGAASVKILNRGFVQDINDQIWVEFEAGPLFYNGTTNGF